MRLIALAAVLLTVFLAACGSDEESPSTPAADNGQFPFTVEHKYGTTTIPAAPKRVVTVGYTDQDPILALGVVPVGVGDFSAATSGASARGRRTRSAVPSPPSSAARRSISKRSSRSGRT